jgi:hypothetical protein
VDPTLGNTDISDHQGAGLNGSDPESKSYFARVWWEKADRRMLGDL